MACPPGKLRPPSSASRQFPSLQLLAVAFIHPASTCSSATSSSPPPTNRCRNCFHSVRAVWHLVSLGGISLFFLTALALLLSCSNSQSLQDESPLPHFSPLLFASPLLGRTLQAGLFPVSSAESTGANAAPPSSLPATSHRPLPGRSATSPDHPTASDLPPLALSADSSTPPSTSSSASTSSSIPKPSSPSPSSSNPVSSPTGISVPSVSSQASSSPGSLALAVPISSRRWYPKAQEATMYLADMNAPEVAEIIKLTRTGNPIYDGITSVMTVADFGLRQRQHTLQQEPQQLQQHTAIGPEIEAGRRSSGGSERGGEGTRIRGGGGGLKKSEGQRSNANKGNLINLKEGGNVGVKKLSGGSNSSRRNGGGATGGGGGGADAILARQKEREANHAESQLRKNGRASFRRVVVDEAMKQYFADRQWFMQEILAPVFVEDITAAAQRVASGTTSSI